MSLLGLKFLGCTVKNFSTNLGLEGQKSSIKINLVEDLRLGDLFTPKVVGRPLSVEFGALKFTGLLQNYIRSGSVEGKYTYEVTLEDPRDILDGCTLILGDFEGTTSVVPNLLNVYGYYESTGFNASLSNSAGMPWNLVRPAIEAMTLAQTSFGGPLNYKGISYSLDLSGLPIPDNSYRIGGQQISLLQIISEICHDMACDFFVELVYNTQRIRVRTISRRMQPSPGVLSNYIATQTTSGICKRSNIGVEARNETCSYFLVGGQQTSIYQTSEAYQYFGQDVNNYPIIGARTDADDPWSMTATLNALEVSDIIGANTYTVDMLEMACAEFSQELWMTYIACRKEALATLLHINGLAWNPTLNGFAFDANAAAQGALFNLLGPNAANISAGIVEESYMWRINRLHSFVKKACDEYLGKKFLIPTRFILATTEAETGQIIQSHNFTNLGYSTIAPLGLNVAYNSFFGPGNGQYQAFCKYDPSNLFQVGTTSVDSNLDFTYTQEEITKVSITSGLRENDAGIIQVAINAAQQQVNLFVFRYKLLNGANPAISDNGTFSLQVYTEDTDLPGVTNGFLSTIGINNESSKHIISFWLNVDDEEDETKVLFYFKVVKINGEYFIDISIGTLEDINIAPILTAPTGLAARIREYIKFLVKADGRLTSLSGIFDLSRVPIESYVFDNTSFGCYVKCSVDDKLYSFSAAPTVYYALVTVDNPVHIAPTVGTGADMATILKILNIVDPDPAPTPSSPTLLARLMRRWAAGTFVPKIRNMAIQPIGFAVPIIDNINTYGPWYQVGALGKVQYEKDNTLTPWDCGGQLEMNAIANAKVYNALSFQQAQETGSFELVGVPAFNIGDVVVTGGPNITSIDIGYSDGGVTTTYRFHTFSNRFGIVTKNQIESARRNIKGQLENEKKIRQLTDVNLRKAAAANNGVRQFVTQQLVHQFNAAAAGKTSSPIITFYCDDWSVNAEKVVTGGIVPMTEAAASWRADDDDEYVRTASMSLDGVLRPISTHLYDKDLESLDDLDAMTTYVKPNANYTLANTVSDLDPFLTGNDIQVLIQGDTADTLDGNNFINSGVGQNEQRVVGLRGPLVISGWGYSVDDCWVPNENPDTLDGDILPGYLRKAQKWKTGPLETLWDEERGVWTGLGHCLGKTQSVIPASGGSGFIDLYQAYGSVINGRIKDRTVYNFFGTQVGSGSNVISVWVPEAAAWYIVAADCP